MRVGAFLCKRVEGVNHARPVMLAARPHNRVKAVVLDWRTAMTLC
ncbi:hypothetical protein roselon_03416 [Roseibacterium elongatum DSM 19469]|uniref:Uncharacterized protein n=1 Tax=Roseicyclus elongatus DSM 19469 TaxID=1294273 RepID=W8RWT2_9RHOB|nr:hypothetical protein roselon_03416 [Roseibacterium elongatum DSM 19469]